MKEYRTHLSNEIDESKLNEQVKLSGFVSSIRNRMATTVIKLLSPNFTFTSSSVDLPIIFFSFFILINIFAYSSPSLVVKIVDLLCRKRPFDEKQVVILGDHHKIVIVVIKL